LPAGVPKQIRLVFAEDATSDEVNHPGLGAPGVHRVNEQALGMCEQRNRLALRPAHHRITTADVIGVHVEVARRIRARQVEERGSLGCQPRDDGAQFLGGQIDAEGPSSRLRRGRGSSGVGRWASEKRGRVWITVVDEMGAQGYNVCGDYGTERSRYDCSRTCRDSGTAKDELRRIPGVGRRRRACRVG
jgi:hypothetical protein